MKLFIEILNQHHELSIIGDPVSTNLKISQISRDEIIGRNKALLFEAVKESPYRVATNLFGRESRIELALNGSCIKSLGQKLYSRNYTISDKTIMPNNLQYTDQMDITSIPAVKSHSGEGGHYFTFPVVITKDPETGVQNMGIYRMQQFDGQTTGMHWHTFCSAKNNFEKAKRMGLNSLEVAVVLGCNPSIMLAAALPFKPDVDEMCLVEGIYGKPIEMMPCQSVDLQIPRSTQMVMEGIVPVDEYRDEGPFAMFTGELDKVTPQPVFHVDVVGTTENPIIPATIPGISPAENAVLFSNGMKLFLPEAKADIDGLIDFHLPVDGAFHKELQVKLEKGADEEKVVNMIKQHRLFRKFEKIVLV